MLNPDAGRVLPRQAHPFEGPTHPLSNTLLFCNFDIQIFDRVLDMRRICSMPPNQQGEALQDCLMIGAHRNHLAVLYACAYASKAFTPHGNALQSVGVSLADLDARIADAEAEEGQKLARRVRMRKRLQRATSGYNKQFAKPLSALVFPYLGSDYTGFANDRGRPTRLATHKFWEVQMKLPQYLGWKAYAAVAGEHAAPPDAKEAEPTMQVDAAELVKHASKGSRGGGGTAGFVEKQAANQFAGFGYRGQTAHPFVSAMSLYCFSAYVGHVSLFARVADEVVETMEIWAQSHDARYAKKDKLHRLLIKESGNDNMLKGMLADQALFDASDPDIAGARTRLELTEAGPGEGATSKTSEEHALGLGDEDDGPKHAQNMGTSAGALSDLEVADLRNGVPVGRSNDKSTQRAREFAKEHASFIRPKRDALKSRGGDGAAVRCPDAEGLAKLIRRAGTSGTDEPEFAFSQSGDKSVHEMVDALQKRQDQHMTMLKKGAVAVEDAVGHRDRVMEQRARRVLADALRSGRHPTPRDLPPPAEGFAEDSVMRRLRIALDQGPPRGEVIER
eukprot:gene4754-20127_t